MIVSRLRRVADFMQRMLGRSRLCVSAAILVRNQARCIIKYHLAEHPDVNQTGEVWLRRFVAEQGTHFVDVGANVGDWSAGIVALKDAQKFHILAFEPSSSAIAVLRARFKGDARISIVASAVGDARGEMTFLEEPGAGRGSTLVPGLGRIDGQTRTVGVCTVDDAVNAAGWLTVDMLKVDAEGYDARVLRGAQNLLRTQRVGVVQFEYNRAWQIAGDTLHGAYRLLEGFGYHVYLLKRGGLYTLDYARYEEYFEYSNFVAVAPAWSERVKPFLRGLI